MWGDPVEPVAPVQSGRLGVIAVVIGMLALIGGIGAFLIMDPLGQNEVVQNPQVSSVGSIQHELSDDPSADGWASELLAQDIEKQLKVISRSLVDSKLINETKARHLVAEEFACGKLRPATLERVFDQSPIYVERAESLEPIGSIYRGSDGLMAALRDLIKPYMELRAEHVHFKTYKIKSADGVVVTDQFVTITGVTDEGRTEENASWTTRWTDEKTPRLLSVALTDYERTTATCPSPLLADCTEAVLSHQLAEDDLLGYGVDYWCARISGLYGMNCMGMHGLAVGDANGDGLDDVYVCHPGGIPNQLLIQNADGTVSDQAQTAGVDWMDATASALFVDLDNDGDQDLVLGIENQLLIMENMKGGSFKEVFAMAGRGDARSLTSADYDNDGDLDIYACFYASTRSPGPLPFHDANNGPPNILLRNDGGWEFTDTTYAVGLDVNNKRFSYAASWEDFDNDGDLDLYVANDYGRNNLYQKSKGRFVDIAASAGVEDIASGMSVSFGDYDHDGRMDLYVGNMFSSAGNRIAYQQQFNPEVSGEARSQFQRHARGNSLFKSLPDGTFQDVSEPAGVTMGRWAWSSRFLDFNNDSFEDVFVVNGYVTSSDPDDL